MALDVPTPTERDLLTTFTTERVEAQYLQQGDIVLQRGIGHRMLFRQVAEPVDVVGGFGNTEVRWHDGGAAVIRGYVDRVCKRIP